MDIQGGRHAVLEAIKEGGITPNSTTLHGNALRAMVVTGPNMGGKSCFIRQAALIAILAQVAPPLSLLALASAVA